MITDKRKIWLGTVTLILMTGRATDPRLEPNGTAG